jgi:hypothetical protein
MKVVAADEVGEVREGVNAHTGVHFRTTDYIGHGRAEHGEGAQAFLVHYPNEGSWLRPHWHRVDQFQVIVGGRGKVGRHEVEPIVVHYADAYTTYGPIVADGEGFSFFTLRAAHTATSYYMPDSKALLPRKRGRELSAHVPAGSDGLAAQDSDHELETLIEPADDGLAATLVSLKPNARGEAPSPTGGGGQYCVVIGGSLLHEGRELEPKSLMFVAPGDEAARLDAGPSGARVVCLQLPRKAE